MGCYSKIMSESLKSIESLITSAPPKVILIGCSSGGIEALDTVCWHLPSNLHCSIIICQHLASDSGNYLVQHIGKISNLPTSEAQSGASILPGHIYFAPGGYHLLIENDDTFSLDVSEKVSYCRPSIDVLFESATTIYKRQILAIILSGANTDGVKGASIVRQAGGTVIVQEPGTAKATCMPNAVIQANVHHAILTPAQINHLLNKAPHG